MVVKALADWLATVPQPRDNPALSSTVQSQVF
jgi:hypothetical protein